MWFDGLWYKLSDIHVKGRMWCVMKKMYESPRRAVLEVVPITWYIFEPYGGSHLYLVSFSF